MGRFASFVLLFVTLLLLANEFDCRVFSTHKSTIKERANKPSRFGKALSKAKGLGAEIPTLPKFIKEPYASANRLTMKAGMGIVFNPCLNANLCRNNGKCVSFGESYYCKCSQEFFGKTCQFAKHPQKCKNHRCKNGATCNAVTESRTALDPDIKPSLKAIEEISSHMKNLLINISYECECTEGYFGPFCEFSKALQKCAEDYCNHHGIVFDGDIAHVTENGENVTCTCHCEQFYSGDRCQYVNPCIDFPCYNEGTCTTNENPATKILEPHCKCPKDVGNAPEGRPKPKLSGKHCEIVEIPDADEGVDFGKYEKCRDPCKNPMDAYECLYVHSPEFADELKRTYDSLVTNSSKKQIEIVNATGCSAFGTCAPAVHNINGKNLLIPKCECNKRPGTMEDEWEGTFCSVEIKTDICGTNKDLCGEHGNCVEIRTGSLFACNCHEGYIGKFCDRRNPCHESENPCGSMGATCHILTEDEAREKEMEFACVCAMKQEVDGASMNCTDSSFEICRTGVCGEGHCFPCDIEKKYGGGLCDNDELRRGYRCICPSGFQGDDCHKKSDACAHHDCQHGICVKSTENILDYTCDCGTNGFKGEFCEIPLDACSSEGLLSCIHGTCVPDDSFRRQFRCECKHGFEGLDCEYEEETDWTKLYVRHYRYTFPATMFVVLLPLTIIVIVCERVRICHADRTPRKGDAESALENTQGEESGEDSCNNNPRPKKPKIKQKGVLPPGGGQRIVF